MIAIVRVSPDGLWGFDGTGYFLRRIDTMGTNLDIPDFIYDLGYEIWK